MGLWDDVKRFWKRRDIEIDESSDHPIHEKFLKEEDVIESREKNKEKKKVKNNNNILK